MRMIGWHKDEMMRELCTERVSDGLEFRLYSLNTFRAKSLGLKMH